MVHYVGYGFNTEQIPVSEWVSLVKKYNKELYEKAEKEAAEEGCKTEETLMELLENDTGDCVFETPCEYLRDLINHQEYLERKKAGIQDPFNIVQSYENYLIFESIRFADESYRAKYIRSEGDFIKLVSKYINVEQISFGNLWEGGDWIDPNYFMD